MEDRLEAIGQGEPLKARRWRVEKTRASGRADLVVEIADEDIALEWLARTGAGGALLGLGAGRAVVSVSVLPPRPYGTSGHAARHAFTASDTGPLSCLGSAGGSPGRRPTPFDLTAA